MKLTQPEALYNIEGEQKKVHSHFKTGGNN